MILRKSAFKLCQYRNQYFSFHSKYRLLGKKCPCAAKCKTYFSMNISLEEKTVKEAMFAFFTTHLYSATFFLELTIFYSSVAFLYRMHLQ